MKHVFYLCVLVLFMGSFAQTASIKSINKKIKRHHNDLSQLDSQIKNLELEKGRLKNQVNSLSRKRKKLKGDILRSSRERSLNKVRLKKAKNRLNHLDRKIHSLAEENTQWKESLWADLRIYHTQVSYPQRLRNHPMRDRTLRALISFKNEQITATSDQKNEAVLKENELRNTKEKLNKINSKLKHKIEIQKNAKAKKDRLYQLTHKRQVNMENEVRRLKQNREELEKLISKLKSKKIKSLAAKQREEFLLKSFEQKRGRFPWPAAGKIVSGYGKRKHPKLNITVISKGIKIHTRPNSPVKSIDQGTVIYAANFRSYGQTVIVDHGGDNYSVYGLLGKLGVKEGQKIQPEKTLGFSNTGSESQIYFELKNRGQSKNPVRWLKKK